MADSSEGLDYWMRWQVPVCALIIVIPPFVAAAVIKRARPEPLRSVDLWVPCWRGLNPLWLLGFRCFVFVTMSSLLSQMVIGRGIFMFYFYTQWTFTLVIVYFAIAAVISAHGCWNYSKRNTLANGEVDEFLRKELEENTPAPLLSEENQDQSAITLKGYEKQGEEDEKAGFWGYTMQIAYQTSSGAVMLTDIVFWGLLVPFLTSEQFKVTFVMACMHSLNAVFLLIDTLLNRLPFPLFRMAYFVLWSSLYVVFQWVLHACGFTWWPYPFLELATPWAPMWYFFLALVHIPCYGVYIMIIKAKNVCLAKFFPHAYIQGK